MDVIVIESARPIVRLASWFLVEAGLTVAVVHLAPGSEAAGGPPPAADHLPVEAPADVPADVLASGARLCVFNAGASIDARKPLFAAIHARAPRVRILDLSPADGAPASGADADLRPPFVAGDLVEKARTLLAA